MEAAAVVDIGLTRSEFWELTPRRFQALLDRFADREIRHARQQQILTAIFANVYRDTTERSEPFTVDDFAPKLAGSGPARPVFDGPAFLRPCNECGVPKWQGHLPYCKTGAKHFAAVLGTVTAATERVHELAESAGKPYLEPKK